MAKPKLSWTWSERNHEIIIHREKGRLTMDDIWNFLHQRDQIVCFDGALAVIMFRINGDRTPDLYESADDGDDQAVIIVDDGTPCPICGDSELYLQYCPACGEKLKVTKAPGDRA